MKQFLVSAAVVILLYTLSIFVVPMFFLAPKTSNDFGSMFGAVNALFSGLALAALFATLWLQNKEIDKQAEDNKKQAQLLQQTAHIHALSALLANYTQQIVSAPGTLSGREETRMDEIRNELENLCGSEAEI